MVLLAPDRCRGHINTNKMTTNSSGKIKINKRKRILLKRHFEDAVGSGCEESTYHLDVERRAFSTLKRDIRLAKNGSFPLLMSSGGACSGTDAVDMLRYTMPLD
jgi:hypothetical protein